MGASDRLNWLDYYFPKNREILDLQILFTN